MNLNKISDSSLLTKIKELAHEEREILVQVLHHLREVERRRLFSTLQYKSIFDYAVKELSYSEDQAYRRISAMRLLGELPQIEKKINSGSLTLSNLGVAASAIRVQSKVDGKKLDPERKLEVLALVENKSKRHAEETLISKSLLPSEGIKPEKIRVLADHVEIRLTLSRTLEQKINKLKGLMAHSDPSVSVAELLEKLCDEDLARRERKIHLKSGDGTKFTRAIKKTCVMKPGVRKTLPASTRRLVWQCDQGRCHNCGSTFAIQIDHIRPLALGGTHDSNNLRLLCSFCNQRAAIEKLGLTKMLGHIDQGRVR